MKKMLMVALLAWYVTLLTLTSIYAETNITATNSTATSTTGQNMIDQDFINTLITLSPVLFFLSICFRFLEFFKEAFEWGGGK